MVDDARRRTRASSPSFAAMVYYRKAEWVSE
jgi:hypothetical protein